MKTINPSTSLEVNGESFDVAQDASKDAEPVEARSRTIKFYTLGCKVNQYETQKIREDFLNFGFKEIDNGQKVDIYLINTCTVTQRADSQSLQLIRRLRKENPHARIVVTGCLTELDAQKIKTVCRRSLIFKNKEKEKIISHFAHENSRTQELKNSRAKNGISYFKNHTRAFLKIQDGCNNFCSYCKVPLVRGPSSSRQKEEIVQEAKQLVKNGFKEIVLSGICLGAYGRDLKPKINLVRLIRDLEKVDALLRLRLSSLEVAWVSDELIELMATSKKLCPHLHIPLQSGDDEILKKMNRHYTCSYYLNLVKKIKTRIPEVAITIDCLVGFPGETRENFLNTEKLIKEIVPLRAHIFPYSSREGTAAFAFSGNLNPRVIRERIDSLKRTAEICAEKYKKGFLGKNKDVLIECRNKNLPDFWEGYTDNYLKVLIKDSRNLENQIVCVHLKKIIGSYILGEINF